MKILTNNKKDELLKHIYTLALRADELLITHSINKRISAENIIEAFHEIHTAAYDAAYILGGLFEMSVMKEFLLQSNEKISAQIKEDDEEGQG